MGFLAVTVRECVLTEVAALSFPVCLMEVTVPNFCPSLSEGLEEPRGAGGGGGSKCQRMRNKLHNSTRELSFEFENYWDFTVRAGRALRMFFFQFLISAQ